MSNQGRKAWRFVIFFSRFITTFLQQGFIKSLGVLIPSLVHRFGSTYATIGFLASLQYALLLVSCPFVKVLSQRIDSRLLSLCGGLVAAISIISAAFVDSAVAFGLLLGLSGVMSSTVYQTCNVMLRRYFKEDYPTANAMAMTGALLGGITLPPIVSSLLASFGTSGAIWILGATFLHYVPAAVTLRPNHPARTIQHTEETDEAPLSNGQQRQDTSNCCCHGAIAEGTGSFAISFRVLGALGLVVVSLVLAFSLIEARHATESSTQSPGTPAAETNGYGATYIQMTALKEQ